VVGAASAYYGGVVDLILMRLADLMIMMPLISVLVVLSGLIGIGLFELALIIGALGGFGGTAVVLKSQALKTKVKPYVDAAKMSGGCLRENWVFAISRLRKENLVRASSGYLRKNMSGHIG
jgi:ABC-type dipeptide/oligopeptide/nickel transport system permease subunit